METQVWFVEPSMARRLGARLLDGLVLAPTVLVGLLLEQPSQALLPAALRAMYEILLVARDGQTLGKRWLGLRVVTLDGGAVPTLGQAAVRHAVPELAFLAGYVLGGLDAVLGIAVFLPVLRGPLHRGLHDHAAGTVVTACRT